MITPTVPTEYRSEGDGFSTLMSFCEVRNIMRFPSSATSIALMDISLPTKSGSTIYGKTTISLIGSSGNFLGISTDCWISAFFVSVLDKPSSSHSHQIVDYTFFPSDNQRTKPFRKIHIRPGGHCEQTALCQPTTYSLCPQIRPERISEFPVLQPEFHCGLQKSELVPRVVPDPLELVRIDRLLFHEQLQPVRKLYLPALAGLRLFEGGEYLGSEDITADDRQVGRGRGRRRFLHEIVHEIDAVFDLLRVYDAVILGLRMRHLLYCKDRGRIFFMDIHHLAKHGDA